MELYKKNRPKRFEQIIGNEATIKALRLKIEKNSLPHFIILTGPSGCGKTTIARIIEREMNCDGDDFLEFNCANRNGVDLARQIEQDYRKKPISGGIRIYYLDEVQKLTDACQSSLLKVLEDTPAHCYFIFATTNPEKLLNTIKTRGTEYRVNALTYKQGCELIDTICEKEKADPIPVEIKEKIIEYSAGSGRHILNFLDKIIDLDPKEMAEVIEQAKATEAKAYDILRALMGWGCSGWEPCLKALEGCDEDPEGIRRYLRTTAANTLLKSDKVKSYAKAFTILQCTDHLFYDKTDLVQACFDIIMGE